jgi:subtilisin family serine protease
MSRPRSPGSRALLSGSLVAALAVGVTTALAGPSAFTAAAAEGQIRVPAGAQAVPDSYIVMFKGGVSAQAVTRSATTLAARHGGKVTRTYTAAVRGFAVRMTAAKARQLAADPAVAFVEQDTVVRLSGEQNGATWGLDRIDQRGRTLDQKYRYPDVTNKVSAYIIDTGIRTSHSDFGGRARVGTDTIGDGRNGQDCHGHGTHVAGTVGGTRWGVAKSVDLYAVRVLSCTGSGSNAGVIGGVDWVTANARKPAVANMSLGGGASPALDQAVRRSIASGVTYALAAGNENQDACRVSPARTAEAITVGATTTADARSPYSNWGTCVDIFAPGSSIMSAWNTNDTATNTISGTSMASPHVAGGAAVYLGLNPGATPQQVRDALVGKATDGAISGPGTGSPNKLLYIDGGGGGDPQPPPGKSFENDADVAIPDAGPLGPGQAVESTINVTGIPGNAPATLKVGVDIVHPYIGDLVVTLIAPDGTAFSPALHNRAGGSADNIVKTVEVNAASKAANGTWRLRAQDFARADIGRINKFTLQF